jgi:hypothetical protein
VKATRPNGCRNARGGPIEPGGWPSRRVGAGQARPLESGLQGAKRPEIPTLTAKAGSYPGGDEGVQPARHHTAHGALWAGRRTGSCQ